MRGGEQRRGRHLSHTSQTAARYYQAVLGKREAARAHALHAKLYKTVDDEEDSEEGDDEGMGEGDDRVDGEDKLQMENEREEIEGHLYLISEYTCCTKA